MRVTRNQENLSQKLQDLSFFADLSAFTLQQHRQLVTITKPLNNHCITYRWLYPANLLITKDDVNHMVTTVKEGIRLLQKWHILDPQDPTDEEPPNSPSSTCGESDAEAG